MGKKVTTHSGSSRPSFDSRSSRNYTPFYSSRGRGYRNNRRPFFRLEIQRPANTSSKREEDKGKDEINNSSPAPVLNVDVEVRKYLHLSNDNIAGRLKQFSSQWQHITSDTFILDSVHHYRIEFVAAFPPQEFVPKEIVFTLQEQCIIDTEIDNLLRKGVIVSANTFLPYLFAQRKMALIGLF